MTLDELGRTLRRMYDEAPRGYKMANIHLFGIKYASQIENGGFTSSEIIRSSGIKDSFKTEISKGIKLAKYVVPKAD